MNWTHKCSTGGGKVGNVRGWPGLYVDGKDRMWMFRTARQESVVVDMRPVVSGIVRRTLATRGRKRGAPRRQAWGDGAKRKVRGTIPLATTTSTMKRRDAQAQRRV